MTDELKKTILRNKKPLLFVLGTTAVVIFFLGSSFLSLVHNKLELKKLQKQSAALDKEHEELQDTLALLKKQDPAYMERIARIKYHMTKKGETEFRFKTN